MRYSKLFGKTVRDVSSDEVSLNAQLLTKAGFVRREMAGVYSFLPLGLRVLTKIATIVREEMDATGAQELLLPALQSKEYWEKTGRWKSFDVLFKVKSQTDTEYALGPSHEEVLVPLVRQFVSSYRDLPLYLYQIQTKFRDELRAKSGILRGREFIMKDLYSFHTSDEDLQKYYEIMKVAYKNVFERCGLNAILTEASGGAFSEASHEYQVLTDSGEDTIFYCSRGDKCGLAENEEISKLKEGDECPQCKEAGHEATIKKGKSIEVGNIFPLGTKFSEPFGLTFKNDAGIEKPVIMGCYGIGISRLMGSIAEILHDDKGILWPDAVAPYTLHLINLGNEKFAEKVYNELTERGVEVLWDDRDVSAGDKFATADLIGIPNRILVSDKQGDGTVEIKKRNESESRLETYESILDSFTTGGH